MPTFDITRTDLSALIFFCFLLVKERPLEINYYLKLINLVTCIFFPINYPSLLLKHYIISLRREPQKVGTADTHLQARGSETLGELPTAEALCHVAGMDVGPLALPACTPACAAFVDAGDRQSVLSYSSDQEITPWSAGRAQGC